MFPVGWETEYQALEQKSRQLGTGFPEGGDIPLPSSITWMDVRPASATSTLMCFAPASIAFSTSSLTTEAGRWMTSPAAIWLATLSGKSCMMSLMNGPFKR